MLSTVNIVKKWATLVAISAVKCTPYFAIYQDINDTNAE